MASDDFKPGQFPTLSWEMNDAEQSLQTLYTYVTNQAMASREWYLTKRARKKRAGFSLRLGAMFAATLAGIIPLLSEIFTKDDFLYLNPVWSSVAIAFAALLVAIDKFGDMTSGWVRYMLTSQEIAQLEESFRLDWEQDKLNRMAANLSKEELGTGLNRCRVFLQNVNKAVRDETKIWADEFLKTLKEIDKSAKEVSQAKELGGINIMVPNGDQPDNGWQLQIGNGPMKQCRGKTASVVDLLPRIYSVQIQGEISGQEVSAESSVHVVGGKIAEVKLELM